MKSLAPLAAIEGRWASAGRDFPDFGRFAFAHIRMIRPTTRLWLDTLMPIAVLAVAAGGVPPLLETIMFVLTMNLIHTGATIFNDIHDIEIDTLSSEPVRQYRPIARGVISVRLARTEAIVAVLAGLVVAYSLSWVFGAVVTVLAAVTLLHEIPPVRVQGRTVVAQAYTTIGLAMLVGTLVFLVPRPDLSATVPFAVYVVLYLGMCETLVKDVRDVDNDTDGGKLTTAVRYGSGNATAAAAAAYSVTAVAWIWFVFQASGSVNWLLIVGTVVFFCWVGYVGSAALRLRRSFSKDICISLHKGSALVFSVLNLTALIVTVS